MTYTVSSGTLNPTQLNSTYEAVVSAIILALLSCRALAFIVFLLLYFYLF